MKRSIVGLAALVLMLGGVGQAKAGFSGSTVDAAFYAPNLQTLVHDFGTQVVNPTASFTLFFGEATTITNTQIIYTGPPASGQYAPDPFNGYVYDFLNSGNLISSLSIDPSSTLPGFNSSYVTLASDGNGGQLVELNFGGGLFFGPNETVVLDARFGPATGAPEPSSLALLGIGAVCSLGYGWRWRRQSA